MWINELDEQKGLQLWERYRTAYVCREFTSAIANVSWLDISKYLASCNFVSVTVDGSTDSAIIENEMVYLHTFHKGEVKTNFIKCCHIQHGTATGVVNAIQRSAETVMDYNTFLSKLVAMGSDGASVMLGKKSGVHTLLQEQQPSMISIHCSAHWLELCYKDAIKKVTLAAKVLTLLTGLYYMYRKSPTEQNQLEECIQMFECEG